jgi:hypothetical protein
METLRRMVRAALTRLDSRYRASLRLEAVGPALYVGLDRHRGREREFADGTRLAPDAVVGGLHFNNQWATGFDATGRLQAGVRFARLLRQSFSELAERAHTDGTLRDVVAYTGVTWFRPHGRAVGIESEPLPAGLRRRWLMVHYRLLIWAFAPVGRTEAIAEVDPRVFWITRRGLLENFYRRTP